MKSLPLKKSPSFGGLFLFLLVCALPVVFFRIGYKFTFISKELILLLFLDILALSFLTQHSGSIKIRKQQLLLVFVALPVFLLNINYLHVLAVFGLYLILLLLVPAFLPKRVVFVWLAWSAMVATIFSFYLYWSMSLGVAPEWFKLKTFSSRMAGVLGQPNLLACLIVVGLFAWLQALFQRFTLAGWRWFYQIPVIIFFWALLLTGSRAGMLAFASALLLLGWGLERAGERKLLRFFTLQFSWSLSLGILLFLFVQPPNVGILDNRVIDFNSGVSSGARIVLGGSALAMGGDHFWTGVGLGGYRRLLGSYMLPVAEWMRIPYDSIVPGLWAHNDFLHIFAECGFFVFLIILYVFVRVLFALAPTKNPQALFCFCAIWSFFVFMQFGHPFNDHVLVFFLIFLMAGALQLSPNGFELKVPKSLTVALLVPCLLFINFYILSHVRDMYALKVYFKSVVSQPLTVERLSSLRIEHGYSELLNDPLTGWEFKYTHLLLLGEYAVKHEDSELAAYLIPEFEEFQTEHANFALTYQLSRLYFMVGEYAVCKKTADRAYALKPDMYHYSNFGHICLVFDISRRENKPVDQLLGKDYFLELQKNKVFSMDVLDANLCAL